MFESLQRSLPKFEFKYFEITLFHVTALSHSSRNIVFIDPAIILSVFMLSFIFVIALFFKWNRICVRFIYRLFTCVAVGDPVITRGLGASFTVLTPPHLCVCYKPGPGFLLSYVVFFLCVFIEISYLNEHTQKKKKKCNNCSCDMTAFVSFDFLWFTYKNVSNS